MAIYGYSCRPYSWLSKDEQWLRQATVISVCK